MFLLVLSPEQDVNGKITFLIEQRMMYSLDGSYNFSAEQENVLLVAIIGGLALGISQFEFLHRKKYASTLFSFSIKRNKLFLNRLIIPLVLAFLRRNYLQHLMPISSKNLKQKLIQWFRIFMKLSVITSVIWKLESQNFLVNIWPNTAGRKKLALCCSLRNEEKTAEDESAVLFASVTAL